MRRVHVGLLAIFGLGCAYRPGEFYLSRSGPQPPTRTQLGCLDLGIGLDLGSPRAPVVRYRLGNGCDHRIRVDLGAARVEGRDQAGNRIALAAHDASWLGERQLGARWFAREVIRYLPLAGRGPELREVCIDVAGVHRAGFSERWVCLATEVGS